MKIKVKGSTGKAKELANALALVLGVVPQYKGGPRHKYALGDIFAEAAGTIVFPNNADMQRVRQVLDALAEHGYDSVGDVPATPPQPDTLTIEMPLEGFTETAISNLEKLTISKGVILKQALNTEALPIEMGEGTLRFPWFNYSEDAETVNAYVILVERMCDMAKRQKRISDKETSADNPKWAMRTFLLRLGFVGDEYKAARRVLTAGLEGDGAFRNGRRPSHTNVTQL